MGGDELFSDTYPMKLVDNCMYEVYGKHISSISSKSDSGASISSNKGGSSTTIGRDNSSRNNRGSSNSNSRSSSNSNSDGSVSCNNSFGSDPGVSSNNGRGMRLLDRLLGAGGADSICTILDDLDINNFLADSLSNLPGGADRDTVAEGSRCGNWASITISGVSISVSISISFTLTYPATPYPATPYPATPYPATPPTTPPTTAPAPTVLTTGPVATALYPDTP